MKLFKNITENKIILYYSNKELEVDKYFYSISHIHIVYNSYEGDNSATIIFLKTNRRYRNKGLATKLLKESIKILKELKIKKIELDDMSDNARTKNNIYKKFGFKYINPYPEPEMIYILK